jgi:hypothetical protein
MCRRCDGEIANDVAVELPASAELDSDDRLDPSHDGVPMEMCFRDVLFRVEEGACNVPPRGPAWSLGADCILVAAVHVPCMYVDACVAGSPVREAALAICSQMMEGCFETAWRSRQMLKLSKRIYGESTVPTRVENSSDLTVNRTVELAAPFFRYCADVDGQRFCPPPHAVAASDRIRNASVVRLQQDQRKAQQREMASPPDPATVQRRDPCLDDDRPADACLVPPLRSVVSAACDGDTEVTRLAAAPRGGSHGASSASSSPSSSPSSAWRDRLRCRARFPPDVRVAFYPPSVSYPRAVCRDLSNPAPARVARLRSTSAAELVSMWRDDPELLTPSNDWPPRQHGGPHDLFPERQGRDRRPDTAASTRPTASGSDPHALMLRRDCRWQPPRGWRSDDWTPPCDCAAIVESWVHRARRTCLSTWGAPP